MKHEPFKDQSRLREWEGTDYLTPGADFPATPRGSPGDWPKALGSNKDHNITSDSPINFAKCLGLVNTHFGRIDCVPSSNFLFN